jgi:2-dehydro-3-deoxyglucarate aldolase
MIETAQQLIAVRDACRWPPAGTRGVGFSRANLFGKHFEAYRREAQAPLLIAMIEHIGAVENLESILAVDGLDAVLIGPYDLSASMGLTAKFDQPTFCAAMETIRVLCLRSNMACGIHVVEPDPGALRQRILEGYRFIAYSIDSVFLRSVTDAPNTVIQ